MNTTLLLMDVRSEHAAMLEALSVATDSTHPFKRAAQATVEDIEKENCHRIFKLFGHDFDEYYANLVDNILFGEAS